MKIGEGEVMQPKEVVRRWVEAFNRHDAEALAALYHDDATNHQVAQDPITGRAAIKAMFAREFATAEMVCLIEALFEDGAVAILEWRDPQGLRGCGFFHIRDGKIAFQRGYWDKLSFLTLHGLPIA
jgi:ketosteroid isomerase-like protein